MGAVRLLTAVAASLNQFLNASHNDAAHHDQQADRSPNGAIQDFLSLTDESKPRREFIAVMIKDGQQLLVVDVSQRSTGLIFAQEPQVREELAESNLGRHFDDFSQDGKRFALCRRDHISSRIGFSDE